MPKTHHEPLAQARKVPPPPVAEHPEPVEAEKPRILKASDDSTPRGEVAQPVVPKPPDTPTVEPPKSPSLD